MMKAQGQFKIVGGTVLLESFPDGDSVFIKEDGDNKYITMYAYYNPQINPIVWDNAIDKLKEIYPDFSSYKSTDLCVCGKHKHPYFCDEMRELLKQRGAKGV